MMKYLEAQNLRITRSGTRLQMTITGKGSFPQVEIVKIFPHSYPNEYIWLGDGTEEIGILRTIDELDADSKQAVAQELARRYFTPVIKKVNRIDVKRDSMKWDVLTDRGEVTFRTKGLQDCLTEIGGRPVLTDVSGNRYHLKPGLLQL